MPLRDGANSAPLDVPAYILAGGRSSRFGSDKARAVIGGNALISIIAEAVRGGVSSVTAVARDEGAYADLGLRTIADVIPDKGPLGGVLTAIDDRGHDGWVLIVACDWVGIRSEWVRALLATEGGGQAVLFDLDHDEPLFALYHTSIRRIVADRIARESLSMMGLLGAIDVRRVAAPDGWGEAVNMNRRDIDEGTSPS